MIINQYFRRVEEPKICKCCKEEAYELYDGICLDCQERFKILKIHFINVSSNDEFIEYAIEHMNEILEV